LSKMRGISTTAIVAIIVVLVVAGGVAWFLTAPPAPAKPKFVDENKLVYESGATYQWMDPHVSYYQFDYWTIWQSVETLVWYERESPTEIIPWLAESYTQIDSTTYEFKLRHDIKFQDGTDFDATAVWFSLNRLLIIDGTSGDPVHPVPGSQAAWMVQQLLDVSLSAALSGEDQAYDAAWVQAVLDQNFVEIVDDYTVRIHIQTPTTQFLPIMTGPWAGIVSPSSTIAGDYEHGGWGTWDGNYVTYFEHRAGNGDTAFNVPEHGWKIGTGAYYVESVDPTTYKIVLKAFDDYWGGPDRINLPPAGKQRIETIEFVYQPSFSTRLLDLKAGTATGISVPEVDIFSVADRDKWADEGELVSIIDGVTVHGVFPTFNTWWLSFNTNVTNPDKTFRSWQPFADWRLRMAAACSVNMTYANIYINNRLSVLANNIIPPGTAPEGSYNPDVKPIFSFNLTKAAELIKDAYEHPMTSDTHEMHYYDGTDIPPGVVDNSFSPANPKYIEFYVQSGADTFIRIFTTMADSLNAISRRAYGLMWRVVIVPGGQQYTLASRHQIDSYIGGWIADYNHVIDWLIPMYLSSATYFSWNLWNLEVLDDLCYEAIDADEAGDITRLLEINDEMNRIANEQLVYMVWWHDTEYYTRSSWLKGWYMNPVYGVDLWSSMYYESP